MRVMQLLPWRFWSRIFSREHTGGGGSWEGYVGSLDAVCGCSSMRWYNGSFWSMDKSCTHARSGKTLAFALPSQNRDTARQTRWFSLIVTKCPSWILEYTHWIDISSPSLRSPYSVICSPECSNMRPCSSSRCNVNVRRSLGKYCVKLRLNQIIFQSVLSHSSLVHTQVL